MYWVNTYCLTFDPRELEGDPVLPFHLFPRQEAFLRWIQAREREQKSGLAEKSRDVGFTWLCSAYAVHGWLFRKGFSAGFGSRKIALVDTKGDPKCIFEKIRFLVEHLPAWMLPAGYKPNVHSGFCKLINPANGATVTGEGGAQIGRGGRTSIYFVDEAAFLQHPKLADAALSANSRVKIWVSTPNGIGNSFYTKRFGGKLAVFTFHWRDDPRKDDAWYAQQKEELDAATLAQEVDIDYTASLEGVAIEAKWVRAAVGLSLKASGRKLYGLDVSAGGRNRTVLIGRQGPVVNAAQTTGQNGTATAHWAKDIVEGDEGRALNYDAVGVGYAIASAFEAMEQPPRFNLNAILGGAAPSEDVWTNGKTAQEMFVNRRAELYWKLRARFEKTWEMVEEGVQHPLDELISIPNDPQLIAELSVPLYFRTETGKIKIESKEAMAKRGVASPDHADALVYTEHGEGADWQRAAEVAKESAQTNRLSLPKVW